MPEFVRYNWAFRAGDQTYQLQVKRTNLLNITTAEAPIEHVSRHPRGDWFFQVRGASEASDLVEGNPVSGCYHLGFFKGEVVAAGTVSMVLPYGRPTASAGSWPAPSSAGRRWSSGSQRP